MKFTIFYSWQSDLPNNMNRGFIETVLEKAAKSIGDDQNFDIEPSIDRDTQGIPGIWDVVSRVAKQLTGQG